MNFVLLSWVALISFRELFVRGFSGFKGVS